MWNTVAGDPESEAAGVVAGDGLAVADAVAEEVAVAVTATVGGGDGLWLAAGPAAGRRTNRATAPMDATRTPDSSPRTIERRGPTRRRVAARSDLDPAAGGSSADC
jgi:hypothetical protein